MPDFTLKTYLSLLQSPLKRDFSFQTFAEFIENPSHKVVILRHDVDARPGNSLVTARIEHRLGIRGSYYFRSVPRSNNPGIIREIEAMGHEIGYHYEDLSMAGKRGRQGAKRRSYATAERGEGEKERGGESVEKELVDIAIESFAGNLDRLRKIAPVKTICMHGSPMSRWDSRLLWKYYDYRDFGIIGEPYFDIDFDEVLYLTDTGRRWDGEGVSVRDKAGSREQGAGGRGLRAQGENPYKDWKVQPVYYRQPATGDRHPAPKTQRPAPSAFSRFHSSFDIINAANEGELPPKIMMTFHPQRWTDKPVPWLKELVWQNMKNQVKRMMIQD